MAEEITSEIESLRAENTKLRTQRDGLVEAEAKAWMVICPPGDECDYRVYFTRIEAEIADEMFRDECLTDEDDAERRTQGVFDLIQRPLHLCQDTRGGGE